MLIEKDNLDNNLLKNLLKLYKIKNYSKLNKKELISKINTHLSTLKIQKFLRSKWIGDQVCVLSLEKVKYPLFAFKPKGYASLIYYNLDIFANYLITTGDFRDPKTREKYSEETLKKIDKELKKNNISVPLKGIYRASCNKRHYKKQKEREENILLLDRCIDDIISAMRNMIENRSRRNNAIQTLNTLFFMTFRSYFRRLVSVSPDHAKIIIERTIKIINDSVKDPNDKESSYIRDNIIQFLYQIQYDELNI